MTKSNSRNKLALKTTKVFGIKYSYTTHRNTTNEKKDKKPKSNTELQLPHINAAKHLRNTKILLSKQTGGSAAQKPTTTNYAVEFPPVRKITKASASGVTRKSLAIKETTYTVTAPPSLHKSKLAENTAIPAAVHTTLRLGSLLKQL